jgi:putative ABC transport system permease protein
MIRNYLTVGWRSLRRHPFYSSLNIIGISTGILFTLLIGAYVWGELQVNHQLRNASRQYILTSKWKNPDMGYPIITQGPLAKRLKEDYPHLVANYFRGDFVTSVISKGDRHFRESIDIGDSTLLTMYGFKLLYGNAHTAMQNPFSVVIKKEIAIKYFGRLNVVGESLTIQSFSNSQHDFLITGVLDDVPENSITDLNDDNHHQVYIPASTATYFPRASREDWANAFFPSYVELQPGVTPKDLEQPLKRLIRENTPTLVHQNLTIVPVALTDYYLQKDNGLVKRMLFVLSLVGLFILLMAIVNFINISISSSSARIKEIGIRKVLGGIRKQIIFQFLAESIILVLIATGIALIFYPIARPLFEGVVGKNIPGLHAFPVYFALVPVALVLVVGLLAGLYPAFKLSSLKSADSIKGKLKTVNENIWLRKSLAGFQFCLACMVIIAALIVTQQVSYFFSQNLGYDKEYVVSSQVPRDWSAKGVQHMETVRNEFAAMPEIAKVTLSYEIPDGMNGGDAPLYRAGRDSTTAIPTQFMATDAFYAETYQIPMKAGSFLPAGTAIDTTKVVMNETAIKALGFTSAGEALGSQVRFIGTPTVFTISGVTSDFHFQTMQQKIPPIAFIHVKLTNSYRYLSFKLKPGNTAATISAIEKKWAALLPGSAFEYKFMDETLERIYKSEIQLKKAAYTATLLAMVIVLLGVIGLVSLSIHKRTKEIGIRKVLGASVSSIIALFVKDFILVIIAAGIIACPVAWLVMNNWLNNYVYRVTLTAQPFVIAVLALAAITVTLIFLQTLKAGNTNPVNSLKTE